MAHEICQFGKCTSAATHVEGHPDNVDAWWWCDEHAFVGKPFQRGVRVADDALDFSNAAMYPRTGHAAVTRAVGCRVCGFTGCTVCGQYERLCQPARGARL